MSIKGTTKELFVGKSEVNIITFIGNKVNIPYDNMKEIEYCFARGFSSGNLTFVKRTNEKVAFEFSSKVNDSILRTIDFISEHAPNVNLVERVPYEKSTALPVAPQAPNQQREEPSAKIFDTSNTQPKSYTKGLKCPKCKGHDIDLWSNVANYKIHQKTSVNLNPLHPLTVFNTKEVKKEKKSAAKIGLGIMTGGTSLLFTGTKNKAHNEYYCRDCGHRWTGK